MNDYDATGGEQGWTMKSKLNELRLDAGIARIENQRWLCVLDKETGMMIDPLIGLEKFAELIVGECVGIADEYDGVGSTIVSRIKKHFGVEDRAVPILSADEQALFAGIASSKLFTIAGAKKHFGVEE
jgi:hypothetical protein